MTATILALGTEDSAVGHLIAARIATRCEPLNPNLIWGSLPRGDIYFAKALPPHSSELNSHWLATRSLAWPPTDDPLPGLRERMAQYDKTELWIDPDANSQLAVMFLLDYLGDDRTFLDRLSFHQLTEALGPKGPDGLLPSIRPLQQIVPADVELASRIWNAYSAPTPESVPPLLNADLSRFPLLHDLLLALLEELPGTDDGLGAMQRWILRVVAEGAETPKDLFSEPRWYTRPATYRYWEVGALIDELTHGPLPALTGIEARPFTLEMHDTPDWHKRYNKSQIALTDFGRDLLAGKADFLKENKIDRSWGGTRLTNENLWRWDSERRELRR